MNQRAPPGCGKSTPSAPRAFPLPPPMDRRKQRYRTHSAEVVVQEDDNFNPALLEAFTVTLKK